MTPNDLEVLIHYFTSSTEHPRKTAPAVIVSINRFLNDGIFERTDSSIIVTERGGVWLDMILETPYPVMKWVDSRETVPNKGTA